LPPGPNDWFVQHTREDVISPSIRGSLVPTRKHLTAGAEAERQEVEDLAALMLEEAYQREVEALRAVGDPRAPQLRERFLPPLERLLVWATPLGDSEREAQEVPINQILLEARRGAPGSWSMNLLLICEEHDFRSEEGVRRLGDRVFRGWEDAGEWARLMADLGTPPERIASYLLDYHQSLLVPEGPWKFERTEARLQALWATGCFRSSNDLFQAVRPGLPVSVISSFA
jgi:hypothetical protein